MMSLFASFDFKAFIISIVIIQLIKSLLGMQSWKYTNFVSFMRLFDMMKEAPSPMIMLTLIFSISLWNMPSVFGFLFPVTSQLSLVFVVAYSFWLATVMFSSYNNLKGFLAHMIPDNSPLPLSIFLFLVELVSQFIRPLTLTIRLVANIVAGHVIMILVSTIVILFFPWSILYTALNVAEMVISIIQAYIFVTLITLYIEEI